MKFLYFAVLVVAILINIAISSKFELIASEKGYAGYFWWCFFLGLVGYFMVAALPNRRTPVTASTPAASTPSQTEELERLYKLHNQGALNDEEYESIKAKILGRP